MNPEMEPKSIFPRSQQQALPYATASLVLGILSILFCITYGIGGLVLSIICLVLSGKDKKLYQSNPEAYFAESYKNSNAGRICAIIGLILSILFFLFFLAAIIFFTAFSLPFAH